MQTITRYLGIISLSALCVSSASADVFITTVSSNNGVNDQVTRILDNGLPLWTVQGTGAEGLTYIAVGPDGSSYTCSFALGSGFCAKRTPDGSRAGFFNVLDRIPQPGGMTVGSDGDLYALKNIYGPPAPPGATGGVIRINGNTGGALVNVISLTSSNLDFLADITQDANGRFFVSKSSPSGNRIVRFGIGGLLDSFIPKGTGGLALPSSVAIGPDGNLYVLDNTLHTVLKYNADTGAYLGTAVHAESLPTTEQWGDMDFLNGDLLVSGRNNIYRFDGTSGAYEGVFASVPTGWAITSMATGVPEPATLAWCGMAGVILMRRTRAATKS